MLTQTQATSFQPQNTNTSTTYTYPSPDFAFSSPTSSSSMAVTILIFLLFLLFIGFFSIFARRVFAWGPHQQQQQHPDDVIGGGPQLPPTARYRHCFVMAGMDPTAVSALPVLKYTEDGGGATSKLRRVGACVVCLGELNDGERVKLIPSCGHVFHPGCIDGWLLLHASCPICRCSEVSVDLSGAHQEADCDDDDDDGAQSNQDDGRKLAALGRSRSFGCRESSATLQRSGSV